MKLLRKVILSAIVAAIWGFTLELVAWIAGQLYRRSRPQGASAMLDAAL